MSETNSNNKNSLRQRLAALIAAHPQMFGVICAVLAMLFWSGNYIAARVFKETISPGILVFWRAMLATLILLPFALPYLKKDWPILRVNIKFLILGAVLGITIPNILIYHAARYSQVMNLSIVSLSSPLFVIILARIFFNEYLSLLRILGLTITICGILLLLSKGDLHILINLHFEKGDLIMFGNTLSFAIYTLLIRKMPKGISGMSFMLNILLLGGFFTLPVMLWEVCTDGFVVFSVSLVAWFVYVSLFSSILGYACWNLGVAYIGSAKTSIIYYLLPVICGIEGAILLDEPVLAIHIISMALIIAGTVLAIHAKKPASK